MRERERERREGERDLAVRDRVMPFLILFCSFKCIIYMTERRVSRRMFCCGCGVVYHLMRGLGRFSLMHGGEFIKF